MRYRSTQSPVVVAPASRDVDLPYLARRLGPLSDRRTEAARRHVLNHMKTDGLPPRLGVG